MLPVHVADSSAAARDAMRPGVRKYYENLRTIFSALPDSYAEHLPRLKIIQDTLANLPYDKFFRDQAVFGDPAEVVDRLQAVIEEFSLSQVICWFDQGSMLPRADVEVTMAKFVDKIIKGADASLVPIEQESRIHLTINQGVARRIGLTVPQSILVRADRVIE